MQGHGNGGNGPVHGASALAPGAELDGRYTIERSIASGGFGITYAARHRTLDRIVAIKEHFPRQLAARDPTTERVEPTNPSVYQWALDRFLQEGRSLARCKHPNIVDVADVFEANGTAYMVLAYEEGVSLARWLVDLGRPPRQAEIDRIVAPLLDALETVHEKGMLHRDIAPDNIIVRPDGTPCLIDFGAARAAIANQSHAISAIVKSGYSPPEQYTTTGRAQGPWSDIYAFGATLWRCVTGDRPVEATDRMIGDRLGSVHDAAGDRNAWRRTFLDGVDRALRLKQADRPQSIGDWRAMLLGGQAAAAQDGSAPTRASQRSGHTDDRVSGGARRSASPAAALSNRRGEPASPVTFDALPSPPPARPARAAGRLPVLMAAAGLVFGLAGIALWYSGSGSRPAGVPRSGSEPPAAATRAAPATGAPVTRIDCATIRAVEPCRAADRCVWSNAHEVCHAGDRPPAVTAPVTPVAIVPRTGEHDCDGIGTISACNAERHCAWSVIRNACRRTATGGSGAATPADCARLSVARCNAAPGCEWRINSSSCVATRDTVPAVPAPGPAVASPPASQASRPPGRNCADIRQLTQCNGVQGCFWSLVRNGCADVPTGSQPLGAAPPQQPSSPAQQRPATPAASAAPSTRTCSDITQLTRCNQAQGCFWSLARNACAEVPR